MTSIWLSPWKRWFRPIWTPWARSVGSQPCRSFRPRPEALDNRTLLSTFTVNNTQDHGNGSLRWAIGQAASGDTIDFSSTLSGATIEISSSSLDIDKKLTIIGLGEGKLTISGSGLSSSGSNASIVYVQNGGALSISNVTISGGNDARAGAGIYDSGSLTLRSVSMRSNVAQKFATGSGSQGGGIYVKSHASLIVTGSQFIQNKALNAAGGAVQGGAIFASDAAKVSLSGDKFTENAASGNQAGSANISQGGGVYWKGGGSLMITDCSFRGNLAQSSQNAEAQGGAVFASGGTKVALTNDSFFSNAAQGGAAGGNAQGGGVYWSGSGAFKLGNSTFTQNTAKGGTGTAVTKTGVAGGTGGEAQGGGLYVKGVQGATIPIANVTFEKNVALAGSGGNGASGGHKKKGGTGGEGGDGSGGALYWAGGNAMFTKDTLNSNRAVAGAGGKGGTANGTSKVTESKAGDGGRGGSGSGGGLYWAGGSATFISTSMNNNEAVGGHGGNGGFDNISKGTGGNGGNGGDAQGGALYWSGGTLTLTGPTLNDNTALAGTGGNGGTKAITHSTGHGGQGGNGGLAYGGALDAPSGTSLALTKGTIKGNQVQGGNGGSGGIGGTGVKASVSAGGGYGGGVYWGGGNATLGSNAVTSNRATGGNGGRGAAGGFGAQGGNAGSGVGGGLYWVSGKGTLSNNTWKYNKANGGKGGSGGAGQDAPSTPINGGAAGAAGSGLGGGLYWNSGNATLTGETLVGNLAGGGAGGKGGAGASIQKKGKDGGGNGGTATIGGVGQGGGLDWASSGTATFISDTFTANFANGGTGGNGGQGGSGEVGKGGFAGSSGNGGAGQGGGIYWGTSSGTLTSVNLTSNGAVGGAGGEGAQGSDGHSGGGGGNGGDGQGGGIDWVSGVGTLNNVSLTKNQAKGGGGANAGDGGTHFDPGDKSNGLSVAGGAGGAGGSGGDGLGGGIYWTAGTGFLNHSSLVSNQVSGGSGAQGGRAGSGGWGRDGNDGTPPGTGHSGAGGGSGGGGGGGGNGLGGGLYWSSGTGTLISTSVSKNQTVGGSGGNAGDGGAGGFGGPGGVSAGGSIGIAGLGGSGGDGGRGGSAGLSQGGGIYWTGGQGTISGGTLAGNVVNENTQVGSGGTGGKGGNSSYRPGKHGSPGLPGNTPTPQGGGIAWVGGVGNLTDNSLTSNRVNAVDVVGQGGGIYLTANLTLDSNTFKKNVANSQGGGLYGTSKAVAVVSQDRFTSNLAQGILGAGGGAQGGGIYWNAGIGKLTLSKSTFVKNIAHGGSSTATRSAMVGSRGGNAQGGGLFVESKALAPQSLVLSTLTFQSNQARGGSGGGGQRGVQGMAGGNGGTAEGGGIYWSGEGTADLDGSTFTKNRASGGVGGEGGSPYDISSSDGGNGGSGGAALGGGIYATGGSFHLSMSQFTQNQAVGGNGGSASVGKFGYQGYGGNGAGGSGGGVDWTGDTLTSSGNSFASNQAVGGGGGSGRVTGTGHPGTGANGQGGGIYWSGGQGTQVNTTLGKNLAVNGSPGNAQNRGAAPGGQGGGVYLTSGASLTMVNVTVADNSAATGGGMLNNASSLALTNALIANNNAGTGADVSGTIQSANNSLIGTPSGSGYTISSGSDNLLGVDPKLGALQNNGGPTLTFALLAGSQAIAAGSQSAIKNPPFSGPPFTDQRGPGFNRIINNVVAIGAYEYQPPETTTTVTSSDSSSTSGESVTFTAQVVAGAPGSNPIQGTVTFTDVTSDGKSTVLGTVSVNSQGVADLSTTSLPVGSQTITAHYNGDSQGDYGFSPSSASVSQNVTALIKFFTTITVTSSPNPSEGSNLTPITFTVTLHYQTSDAPKPTGTFSLSIGETTFAHASAAMNDNTWVFTDYKDFISAGDYRVTASYSGDSNYAASSQVLTQKVNPVPVPTLTLTSSPNPSTFGQLVTFTATASPSDGRGIPSGTVIFVDTITGTPVFLATVPLDSKGQAIFATSSLDAPTHLIQAIYDGDFPIYAPAYSNPVSQTVKADVTSGLSVQLGAARHVRGGFVQTVSLENISGSAITGPLYLVLDRLSPGVRLLGAETVDLAVMRAGRLRVIRTPVASGATRLLAPSGRPYVVASDSSQVLSRGGKIVLQLHFRGRSAGRLQFVPRVFAGINTSDV